MKELRKIDEYDDKDDKDIDRARTFHHQGTLKPSHQQDETLVSDALLDVFRISKQALTTAWETSHSDK